MFRRHAERGAEGEQLRLAAHQAYWGQEMKRDYRKISAKLAKASDRISKAQRSIEDTYVTVTKAEIMCGNLARTCAEYANMHTADAIVAEVETLLNQYNNAVSCMKDHMFKAFELLKLAREAANAVTVDN